MKRIVLIFIFILTIILTGITTTGCTDNSGYKKVTVTKQGIEFSFEYPTTYQNQDKANPLNELDFRIVLLRPDDETVSVYYSNINTVMNISLFDTTEKNNDARSYLDDCLLNYSDAPEYELIERSKIIISEIEGEFVLYKYLSRNTGEYLDSKVTYFREVYLDYKNKIWIIGVFCYPEFNDQVKMEFERIIKSFKFLD